MEWATITTTMRTKPPSEKPDFLFSHDLKVYILEGEKEREREMEKITIEERILIFLLQETCQISRNRIDDSFSSGQQWVSSSTFILLKSTSHLRRYIILKKG